MIKDIYTRIKNLICKINNKYETFINKKYIHSVMQFFPRNIFLLILLFFVLFVSIVKIKNNDVIMVNTSFSSFTDEIVNKSISQKIDTTNVERFNKIGILVGTFARENTATYEFNLYKNLQLIDSKKINSSEFQDCAVHFFEYDNIKVKKDDVYTFELKPIDAKKGNAIAVIKSDKTKSIYYQLKSYSECNMFVYISFVIFFIIVLVINYLINNNYIKSINKFYILMLIFFIPTLLLIPALQIPDETYHFSKAYSLSQYNVKQSPYKNSKRKITSPKNLNCLYYSMLKNKANTEKFSDNVTDVDRLTKCFKSEENTKNQPLKELTYSKVFSTIFPTIGIKLADIVSNSPIVIFYVGRIFNFLLSFLIILYALKKLKNHKNIVLLTIMTPMFIYQMISYSYDSMLNALCILVGCYLINFFTTDDKIEKKDLIIYMISSILIAHIKLPYLLIPALILLVDSKKFGDKKYKKYLFIFIMLVISYFFSKGFDKIPDIGKVTTGSSELHPSNLTYLLHNPVDILRVAKHTVENIGVWYFVTMIGSLGWLRYLFDNSIVYIYLAAIIVCIISDKFNMNIKKRILGIIFLLALVGGIFLSMYISWSPYKSTYVIGVQGRYFLPLIVPFALLLMPKNKLININDKFIMSFVTIIQLYSIVMVLVSFY